MIEKKESDLCCGKGVFGAYADSDGSDQPAYLHIIAQSDEGLFCPLTELLETGEYIDVHVEG